MWWHQNLNRWIDLIWGFQQQGAAAEAAYNVFYHLTYESALLHPSMQDPLNRRSAEAQIANFGQVPTQLFVAPHPRRLPFDEALQHKWSLAMASAVLAVRSSGVRKRVHATPHSAPVCALLFPRGKGGAVTVDLAGFAAHHR